MISPLRVLALSGFLSLAGCTYNGNVTFAWTFNGGQSCEAAGVSFVQVQVAGFAPIPFPCRDYNGFQVGTVFGVPSGPQPFTLAGLSCNWDPYGNCPTTSLTYQSPVGGTVTVLAGGTVQVPPIDLAPINPPANSNITFLWTFGGKTCAQAGVANVTVLVVDGSNPAYTVPCTQGGVDGATAPSFMAGTYPFTLTALDVSSVPTYSASGSAATDGINNIVLHVDLGSLTGTGTGTLSILWTFGGKTCAQAGVQNIHFSLRDNQGNIVSGADQTVSCSMFGSGVTIQSLDSNVYWFEAQGQDGSSKVTYVLNPYQVYISPGGTSTYTPDLSPI